MHILRHAKDGGPASRVDGYWLIEIKSLFSIALLRFGDGSREAYHSHAFNAVSWVLKGQLEEHVKHEGELAVDPLYGLLYHSPKINEHRPSFKPVFTWRDTFHKVYSRGTTWVLTFRGPWSKTWTEESEGRTYTLTHGRREVGRA